MKKLRIMLLSLALFAVVGGALAFKAKYTQRYCTNIPVGTTCPANLACPTTVSNSKIDDAGIEFVCTTTFNDGCVLNCTTEPSVKLSTDGGM